RVGAGFRRQQAVEFVLTQQSHGVLLRLTTWPSSGASLVRPRRPLVNPPRSVSHSPPFERGLRPRNPSWGGSEGAVEAPSDELTGVADERGRLDPGQGPGPPLIRRVTGDAARPHTAPPGAPMR